MEEFLSRLAETDTPIIVEGKRDAAALATLGARRVRTLDRPLHEIIEELSVYPEVIILTDLDAEGRHLYRILASGLAERKVRIDRYFREHLLQHTALSHIEGLATYAKRNPSGARGKRHKKER